MKSRSSIDILVTQNGGGSPVRLRIIAKASRYLKTRYWVVLPPSATRAERWLLEPTVAKAVDRVSRWLLTEAHHCIGEPSDTPVTQPRRQSSPDTEGLSPVSSPSNNSGAKVAPSSATLA